MSAWKNDAGPVDGGNTQHRLHRRRTTGWTWRALLLVGCAAWAAGSGLALAQDRHGDPGHRDSGRHEGPGPGTGPGPGWRGGAGPGRGWHGDIRHFPERDLGHWRGGRWFHGVHGGRSGWWWIVEPNWYFYPAPLYPYPDPYLPSVLGAAPPGYWYYCPDPPGYYPYVAQCFVRWRAVPAR